MVLECAAEDYRFSLSLDPIHEHETLATIIRACGVERIHIHHMMEHSAALWRVLQDTGLPFDFTIHDYYTICPQVTLSDEHGRYCGEPDEAAATTASKSASRATDWWIFRPGAWPMHGSCWARSG